ncbi:MAG: glycosyltransferase family 4 protein [Cyclobacteriaceae bacterium]|nr:glycosyltransferase family 4 protein [Cyclobacteriaceae bacterium]
MKICIINYFAGNRDSGWGERHFFIGKELLKKGCKLLIISSASNHMFDQAIESKKTFTFENYEGVDFCWVKVPKYSPTSVMRFWSMWVFTMRLFLFPFKRAGVPEYIIVSSMPMFPVLPALYFKRKFKVKKLAFEVRDLWPLTPVYLGNVSKYNPMVILMKIIERIAYKRSDIILSLLPRADKYINPITGYPNKFVYLPNGISEQVNTNEELPFASMNIIPANKFVVGYAGSLGIANAMEYVVDAARILRNNTNIHFVILGEGYQKKYLVEKAKDISNVTFLPKVKKGVVSKVISKFDTCIISWNKSDLYQFGVSANKLFDYMLASKPIVIAGNLADNPVELSKSGICVEPESGDAIAKAILDMFNLSKEMREKYGRNGRSFLEKNHTYAVLAQRLVASLNG